jgi:hypothetical protein
VEFEWDLKKAATNWHKHGVSFEEAAAVFGDPLSIAALDPDHSLNEERFLLVGHSDQNRLLIIAYTERGEKIRIISARGLTRAEREDYEQEIKD